MFGIKLKVYKSSGRFNDLNEADLSFTFTPHLNRVIKGQPVFIAIFGIKSKIFMSKSRWKNPLKLTQLNPNLIQDISWE